MSKHVRANAQPCKWIICIHSGERYGSRSAFKIADVELWLISKIRRPSSIRNIFLSYVAVPHIFPTIRSRNTDFPTNINLLTPSSFPLPPPTISRGCRFFLLPISNFFLLNYYYYHQLWLRHRTPLLPLRSTTLSSALITRKLCVSDPHNRKMFSEYVLDCLQCTDCDFDGREENDSFFGVGFFHHRMRAHRWRREC